MLPRIVASKAHSKEAHPLMLAGRATSCFLCITQPAQNSTAVRLPIQQAAGCGQASPATDRAPRRTVCTTSLPALGSFFALAGFCSTDSSAEAVCRDVSDSAPTQSSRAQLPAQGMHRSKVLIKVYHAADAPVLLTTNCNFNCWWTTQRSHERDVSLSDPPGQQQQCTSRRC